MLITSRVRVLNFCLSTFFVQDLQLMSFTSQSSGKSLNQIRRDLVRCVVKLVRVSLSPVVITSDVIFNLQHLQTALFQIH